jgi:hypothetical protein
MSTPSTHATLFPTPEHASKALSKLAKSQGAHPEQPLSKDGFDILRSALLAGGRVDRKMSGVQISEWACLFAPDKKSPVRGFVQLEGGESGVLLDVLMASLDSDEERRQVATRLVVDSMVGGTFGYGDRFDPVDLLYRSGARPLMALLDLRTRFPRTTTIGTLIENHMGMGVPGVSTRPLFAFDELRGEDFDKVEKFLDEQDSLPHHVAALPKMNMGTLRIGLDRARLNLLIPESAPSESAPKKSRRL